MCLCNPRCVLNWLSLSALDLIVLQRHSITRYTKIIIANRSYTYVAQISLPGSMGRENYFIFFSLERNKKISEPALLVFIKSAYINGLAAPKHAQSWLFAALAGEITGVYPTKRP